MSTYFDLECQLDWWQDTGFVKPGVLSTDYEKDLVPCSKCGEAVFTREPDGEMVCLCGFRRGPLAIVPTAHGFVAEMMMRDYPDGVKKCVVRVERTKSPYKVFVSGSIVNRTNALSYAIATLVKLVRGVACPTPPDGFSGCKQARANWRAKQQRDAHARLGALTRIIRSRMWHAFQAANLLPRLEDKIMQALTEAYWRNPQFDRDRLAEEYMAAHPYLVSDVVRFPLCREGLKKVLSRADEMGIAGVDYHQLTWQQALSSRQDHTLSGVQRKMLGRRWIGLRDTCVLSAFESAGRVHRPVASRLDVLLLDALHWNLTNPYASHDCYEAWSAIYNAATTSTIKKALRVIQRTVHQTLDLRKPDDIACGLRTIVDGVREIGKQTSLVKLAEQSVRHHRDLETQRIQAQLHGHYPEERVAVPPIAVPDEAGVTFLTTLGAIIEEGVVQGHCVGGYALCALRGECYLFHGEKDGETATCQVDPHGRVVQCRGPRNRDNGAARWLHGVCARWGKQLPTAPRAVRQADPEDAWILELFGEMREAY